METTSSSTERSDLLSEKIFLKGSSDEPALKDCEFKPSFTGSGSRPGVTVVAVSSAGKDGSIRILYEVSSAEPVSGFVAKRGNQDAGGAADQEAGGRVL